MLPRLPLDIGWSDLAVGFGSAVVARDRERLVREIEQLWSPGAEALAALSVRSGFDLLLAALNLPAGSEIAYTAATIGDMVRIIEHHGLKPVPIDLDMHQLGPRPAQLEAALSARTRAILFVHLFGARHDLGPIAEVARHRQLLLIEDCAHAFVGRSYVGDPLADVSLFSFGPIKTATALGGAMLTVRNPELLARMRTIERQRPLQGRSFFARRCLKYALLKAACWPPVYGALFKLCQLLGQDPNAQVSRMVRGFAGSDLFAALRRRPSVPLLALLARRLRRYGRAEIEGRRQVGEWASQLLDDASNGNDGSDGSANSTAIQRPGRQANDHTYWLYPVLARRPERLVSRLQAAGFDAARGTVSFGVIDPDGSATGDHSPEAQAALSHVVYLPLARGLSKRQVERICAVVQEDAAAHGSPGPAII